MPRGKKLRPCVALGHRRRGNSKHMLQEVAQAEERPFCRRRSPAVENARAAEVGKEKREKERPLEQIQFSEKLHDSAEGEPPQLGILQPPSPPRPCSTGGGGGAGDP